MATTPGWRHRHEEMKQYHRLFFEIGLILSLLLLIILFRAPIRPAPEPVVIAEAPQETIRLEEEVPQTKQELKPPPPVPPPPVPVPDEAILGEEEVPEFETELDINRPLNIPPPPPPEEAKSPEEKEEEEPEIFVAVEEMPEIIGGPEAVYKVLEYPEIARRAGLEGLVIVQVIVEPDGRPSHPTILKSAGDILDQAAIKAVMKLRFKPGKQRGKPVRVRYAIPIRFKLKD